MKTKAYTLLGWMAWQGAVVVAKRKWGQRRTKLGVAVMLLLVVAGALLAAKATTGDDT